jgi:hypothetical protein
MAVWTGPFSCLISAVTSLRERGKSQLMMDSRRSVRGESDLKTTGSRYYMTEASDAAAGVDTGHLSREKNINPTLECQLRYSLKVDRTREANIVPVTNNGLEQEAVM